MRDNFGANEQARRRKHRRLVSYDSNRPKTTARNPRSTVGTVTEIYDYLRLLYARVGVVHCPSCGKEISQQTVDQIIDKVLRYPEGTKIMINAPVVRGRKGEFKDKFELYRKSGFARVNVDGKVYSLDEDITLDRQCKHDVSVVIDRIVVKSGIRTRLSDSIETALKLAEGLVVISKEDGDELFFYQIRLSRLRRFYRRSRT